MIRSNLVTLLIILSLGWIVDGYAEAAKPIVQNDRTGNTIQQLLKIVGVDREVRTELALEPRVPMPKPAMLERTRGQENARLLIKFTDQIQMRVDAQRVPYSHSKQDVDSIAVILEELNLTLRPVFSGPEARLTELLKRAEVNSGVAQPDLAGIFYVEGTPEGIDSAAMILLHDPRVEWAGYRNDKFTKTTSDRIDDAINTQRQQNPAMDVAMDKASSRPTLKQSNVNLVADNGPSATRFGAMSDADSVAQFNPSTDSDRRRPDDVPTRGGVEACCVSSTELLTIAGQDTPPTPGITLGQTSNVGGATPVIFNTCLQLDSDACDAADGAYFAAPADCTDPLNPNFVVCQRQAPGVVDGWSPYGACCTDGVQTFATLGDCEPGGVFVHNQISRFVNASYFPPPAAGLVDNARIPQSNPQLNIDLVAKTYGFENMVIPGGDLLVAQDAFANAPVGPGGPDFSGFPANQLLNSNYSYFAGSDVALAGNGIGGFPGSQPFGGTWVAGNFVTNQVPGVVPKEPIFTAQNATFPYATNTGIAQANFGAANGPDGGPLGLGQGYAGNAAYPGAFFGDGGGPWVILWGPVDIAVNTATGQAFPAVGNQSPGANNPSGISGGFTFTTPSLRAGGQLVYNPNVYLAGPDGVLPGDGSPCDYGVCAIDCWRPSVGAPADQGCGPDTAFAGFPASTVPESPLLGADVATILPSGQIDQVPNTNVGCSNYVYETYCQGSLRGKTFVSDLNGTGSLWADLNILPPAQPALAGCQTINAEFAQPNGWWAGFFVVDSNECVDAGGNPGYVTYEAGEEADPLKGSCFFSNMNYPAMFTNAFSPFQLQAFGDLQTLDNGQFEWFYEPCYGGDNADAQYCPTYCSVSPLGFDAGLPEAVCAAAPLCCDSTACVGPIDPNNPTLTTAELSGWSFLCADLANQWKLDPYSADTNNPTYNTLIPFPTVPETSSLIRRGSLAARRNLDFDQTSKLGGPFPELNVLGLQAPYARNADGSIWDDPNTSDNDPTLIQPSLNCMINYGVQNQCFTTYFSEFQPSLGLAPNSALPPFNRKQNGGCMDFQCCHTVCSIVFNPATDDFNYGNCCDPEYGWTEECVDKAIELCYENEGGVRSRRTPNFVPLQFHLSQRTAAGPQPFRLFDQATRRLAAAPTLPPTVVSSIPGLPTFPADNWLQSANMAQWVVSPRTGSGGGTLPILGTWAAPSVQGRLSTGGVKYGVPIEVSQQTGQIEPVLNAQPNNANSWQEFYYGEPNSAPPTFYESQGLSLYGTLNPTGWGGNPAQLTPTTGLYSWSNFLLSLQESNGPAGPNNIGAYGFGVNIAVLDTSAWIQEYVNAQGQLVGAVHEDLGNVLMEGPATGDEFVPMGFENFIYEPQRGTAVLGTIAAAQNGFGTDGIALQANTMFFPVMTAQGSIDREFNAWLTAMTHLKRGDILLATYPGGGASDNIWIDGNGDQEGSIIGLLFALSAALEISVVLPVGDFGVDLGGLAGSGLDTLPTNVLSVGGSMPSTLPKRAWSSNYIPADDAGVRPLITAITPITTTGGDCNLTRAAIGTNPDQPNDPPGYISRNMKQRSYTNDFGYLFDASKAAAAQVAGVAACLQGLSMQWYGASQPGSNMAAIINNNPRRLGGFRNGPASQETTYSSAPLEGIGWQYGTADTGGGLTQSIGLMIDPARAGVDMIINPLWDVEAPEDVLTEATFIRGFQLDGDYTSLQQPGDSNELVGYSQFTFTFLDYEPEFFVPGAPFNYNASFDFAGEEAGEVTDLFIHGRSNNKDLPDVNSLAFDVQMSLSPDPEEAPFPPTELLIFPNSPYRQGFAYNYTTERWDLMDNTIGFYPLFTFEPPSAFDGRDYLGFEGAFDVRFVLTLPVDVFDPDGAENEYVVFYDYVSLRVSGPIDP